MRLWVLSRHEVGGKVYDCFHAHVIAAPTEDAARAMAAGAHADEGAAVWSHPTFVTCEHIGDSNTEEAGIVLSDFHAG